MVCKKKMKKRKIGKSKNKESRERQVYVPASVKVIETSVQRVICASDNEGYNDGNTSGWYNN